ncbi:2-polyprenyl-6-methoxyphenol hydroxylase-like FAD-dependent oxidoreductase [Crossiella equi]|uniref:2-polyprenyl-6-methoxyphenol hydroxylase-like FAD-dependent oxidoreductase n=1 Tax=Crossiella equi TaxID=130796 RepID=A0ABS5A3Y9_9PSEU|nr:FAD-dependent monooxygenase [Crossiella equi]MBP2471293.1 2-polyprenyl-6-methoxyphenol hydroxylase-like FAD-dependent oxidoreductase [Crossiella equi]
MLTVLISGASVAGPSLAHWLHRQGHAVTVVERAPEPRRGGFAVDFRGPVHLEVLRRMGILDELRAHQTDAGDMWVVGPDGRRRYALPARFTAGDLEVLRGDLSQVLYDRTRAHVEYVFDDSVDTLTDTPGGVEVTFERGRPRRFDLVVGADGLHSRVRRLAFGPEERFLEHLGYYLCGYRTPGLSGQDNVNRLYNEPGRGVSFGGVEGGALLVFAAPDLGRVGSERAREVVAERFTGMGWRTAEIVAAAEQAPEVYFDSISRVRVPRLSRGRVVLLGDAGYGATCGGLGTGLAVVCAHVLAGELAAAGGDHRVAFARYEEVVREYTTRCQKTAGNAGPFLAPRTARGIRLRDAAHRLLTTQPFGAFLNRMSTMAAAGLRLPDYPC